MSLYLLFEVNSGTFIFRKPESSDCQAISTEERSKCKKTKCPGELVEFSGQREKICKHFHNRLEACKVTLFRRLSHCLINEPIDPSDRDYVNRGRRPWVFSVPFVHQPPTKHKE